MVELRNSGIKCSAGSYSYIVSIPPKVSVSTYMRTIKGKTAIKLFKSYPMLKRRPYWG